MIFRSFPRLSLRLVSLCVLALGLGWGAAPILRAAGSAFQVVYDPLNNPVSIFDAVPAGTATSYPVGITSPGNFPTGATFAPTFEKIVTGGSSEAASFVTIALDPERPAQPTAFTGANQTIYYRVTGVFPLVTVSTTYSYTIKAVGWPMDPATFSNGGHHISATSVPPPVAPNPPSVVISDPLDGATFTYPLGGVPATLPLTFKAVATNEYPVLTLDAELTAPNGIKIPLAVSPSENINLATAIGTAPMPLSGVGTYSIKVNAHNSAGDASATGTFHVVVTEVPPTVTITTAPVSISYPAGAARPAVPFAFKGVSTSGNITALSAKLNGVDVSAALAFSGLNSALTATGSGDLSIPAKLGENVVEVSATNQYGTSAIATARFTVKETPALVWPTPAPIVYGTPLTATQLNASASVAGAYSYSPAAGAVLPAGTQTLTVTFTPTDSEKFLPATATVTQVVTKAPLVVKADDKSRIYGSANPAFTAVISGFVNSENLATSGVTGNAAIATPATTSSNVGAYAIVPTLGTLQANNYSFSFVNGALAVTKAELVATADNKSRVVGENNPAFTCTMSGFRLSDTAASVAVTGAPLYSTTATVASAAGDYPIVIDPSALQATNYKFVGQNGVLKVLAAPANITISGTVFLDVSNYGTRDYLPANPTVPKEPGLMGIAVKLYRGATVVATTTTSAAGGFTFSVAPDTYEIDAPEPAGLTPTDSEVRIVTATNVFVRDIGLRLDLKSIRGMIGEGHSHGYWKSNLTKTNPEDKGGLQETYVDLLAYTTRDIPVLALSPFNDLASIPAAAAILSGSKEQLSVQLLASEYNFVSGRLINASVPLTYAFVLWGEYALSYGSATEQGLAKDWMDAFNNSYGDKVLGPLP